MISNYEKTTRFIKDFSVMNEHARWFKKINFRSRFDLDDLTQNWKVKKRLNKIAIRCRIKVLSDGFCMWFCIISAVNSTNQLKLKKLY